MGPLVVTLYDQLGLGYGELRRADPRVAQQLRAALGAEGPVVNVGAGAGSYEPADLAVVAVEPSVLMLRQRRRGAAPAVRARAESLPFGDGVFAGGMAVLTVHHWSDIERGLAELRRVSRGPVAVLTWDQEVFASYWMVAEYVPASGTLDKDLPKPEEIAQLLGGGTVEVVPVPHDCTDGFYAAYWRRPEAYLDADVRGAISALARLSAEDLRVGLDRLEQDLRAGTWHRRHADLLGLDSYDAGYRLVVSEGGYAG